MVKIGPSFSDELRAAGLMGLPFSWRESDGALGLNDPRLTNTQRTAVQAVLAAHDPTRLSKAQMAKQEKTQALTDLLALCTLIEADTALPAKLRTLTALLKRMNE